MGKIKGCSNESCEAHKKKIAYKEVDLFCPQCGDALAYVCKDCYTQLPNDVTVYCERCLAEHKDRKDRTKKVVGAAIAVVGVIGICGKKAMEIVKSIRG